MVTLPPRLPPRPARSAIPAAAEVQFDDEEHFEAVLKKAGLTGDD